MSFLTPRRRVARRSTLATALTAVLALVGSAGERREVRQELKALRTLVRTKVDGEVRAALLAQVKERLAKA